MRVSQRLLCTCNGATTLQTKVITATKFQNLKPRRKLTNGKRYRRITGLSSVQFRPSLCGCFVCHRLVVDYRHFGIHTETSVANEEPRPIFRGLIPEDWDRYGLPETSVASYQPTTHIIPENRRSPHIKIPSRSTLIICPGN